MINKTKDLQTGIPVWTEYTTPRLSHKDLDGPIKTDVLIVGAGISGAMMAEALAGSGLDVVIVDKRKPLTGSTAATTALIQFEIDTPLTHLMDKIGKEKAAAAWRRSKLAVESLAGKIRELEIACDYHRKDSLYLSGNVLNSDALEIELAARKAIGLAGEMLSQGTLRENYGVHAKSALRSWDNIAANPVQLASGFLKAAIDKGASLYTPVTIDELKHFKNHVDAYTTEGVKIRARHVIFATGYEIPKYIHTRKHKIDSTWAIYTKPVKGMPKDFPSIWQAADPYLYMRTTVDGRIICGGEDAEFSDTDKRDTLIPRKAKAIERKLRLLIPDIDFQVAHSWAGSFGNSTTGLPSIGQIPGMPHVYSVMAYGGNGITFSRIAAEIISSKILGHFDPDMKLFAFGS